MMKKSHSTLLFAHIPKAAGTTLNRYLEKEYRPWNIFTFSGYKPHKSRERFINSSDSKRTSWDVVKGHGAWSVFHSMNCEVKAITVLRDPIDRCLSEYYYARQNTKHHLHQFALESSIVQYMTSEKLTIVPNSQTRALSSKIGQYSSPIDEDDLAEAKKNIDEYFVVAGISERFEESVALMRYKLGWKSRGMVNQNKTGERKKKNEISEEVIALIQSTNQYDCILYDWVKIRLEKELAELGEKLGPHIDALQDHTMVSSKMMMNTRASVSRIVSMFAR